MEDITRDKASVHEKIILACNNIQWHNYQLSQLIAQFGFIAAGLPDGTPQKRNLIQAMECHQTVLDQALKNLGCVLEAIGNYVNGIDAVTQLDVRVTTPGNEVVLLGMDDLETNYEAEERKQKGWDVDTLQ